MSFRNWLSGGIANAKAANPAKDGQPDRGSFAPFAPFAVADTTVQKIEAAREAYEERAAIMEHDGGLSREDAERAAWMLVLTRLLNR